MSDPAHAHGHDDHGHDHHELGFWRKWVFSTDHKVIGMQYGVTGLVFLLFGFGLMMLMRWTIAHTDPVTGTAPLPPALPGFEGEGSFVLLSSMQRCVRIR